MKVTDDPLDAELARLRAEFDASFGAAPRVGEGDEEPMLLLRIGDDPLAVRTRDVTGLLPCRNVVALPSRAPELVGIVGVRGAVVPVFSLARLLGYAHDPDAPRWLLLPGPELGISFARLERYIRAPAEALQPVTPGDHRSAHVTMLLDLEGTSRPVVSIRSMARHLVERNPKESRS